VHADETGTAVGTTKHWAHTLTTKMLTLIAVHPKRGFEALQDIGVLMDAKAASEAAASTGHRVVDPGRASVIRAAYHAGLDEIFALLPPGSPPRRRARPRWSEAQRKGWNLATRLRVGDDQFLACLDDTRVAGTTMSQREPSGW
jgi:hypothetical protein